MARRKVKAHTTGRDQHAQVSTQARHGFFPFARYTSVVGVHTSLLAFAVLFLPQTIRLFSPDNLDMRGGSTGLPPHWSMEALTADPVLTLVYVCGGLLILQGWWGGWIRKWWLEFSLEGSDDEKRVSRSKLDEGKFTDLRNAWLATLASSFIIHAILVLFGAPFTSHLAHNYLLACLMSLLVVFASVYTLGVPSLSSDTESFVRRLTWIRLFAELSSRTPVERAVVYPAVGAILGCWAGVFPIPLDWDRAWQAWPLTPAFGAVVGYVTGSLWALTVNATRHFADIDVLLQSGNKVKTT